MPNTLNETSLRFTLWETWLESVKIAKKEKTFKLFIKDLNMFVFFFNQFGAWCTQL